MIESFEADLWTHPADIVCITTNGDVNKRGLAVMGRGVARQAVQRYGEEVQRRLAAELQHGYGLHFSCIWNGFAPGKDLYAFPVKYHWYELAGLPLIRRSAEEMAQQARNNPQYIYLLPRPGCGNGGLTWAEVKPIIAPILPDNVVIVSPEKAVVS